MGRGAVEGFSSRICAGEHSPPTGGAMVDDEVVGSLGALVTGAFSTGRAAVRSPVTDRRQVEMLGADTLNRDSRNLSWEVWSNVSWHTNPPAEKGDTTII